MKKRKLNTKRIIIFFFIIIAIIICTISLLRKNSNTTNLSNITNTSNTENNESIKEHEAQPSIVDSLTQEEIEISEIMVREENNSEDNANSNEDVINYYPQILPNGDGEILYNESTDTLKVIVEFNERSSGIDYYTTYIWVKDAYKQFKSQVPENYGKERLLPKKLIENAVKDNNLENKLVVGINASGYEASGSYVNTPAMPLVISNGKVIRNDTASSSVNFKYNTYGMTKDGLLKYYPYSGNDPVAVAQNIFDDGVQNTFAWFYRLVVDGKPSYKSSTRTVLQGICQIDKNNFVFVTDIYESSRLGFTYTELGEYMVSLGCQTGYNLDGGGSVQLVYKPSNGEPIELTKNPNNRAMPDVIYFHE